MMLKRISAILLFCLLAVLPSRAKVPDSSIGARRIFDKAYAQVFGAQGSSFSYDVNISGLYKTHGSIWMKGKKARFQETKVDCYNDGVTAYMIYKKKKLIEIHPANSDKKDKYSGKFKFELDDFDYSMASSAEGLLLTLRQRKDAKGTIKEVKALIDAKTYAPKLLKVKVYFLWATVNIRNFMSGNISDQTFVFPRSRYGSAYKYVDKR